MATFAFKFPQLVFEAYSREPARWREDGKLLDSDGVEVPTTDLNGVPGPLRTGSTGVIAAFKAPVDAGTAVFGQTTATLVVSDEWIMLRDRVDDIVQAANLAVENANSALAKATPVTYVGREPDGRLYVSMVPIEYGGTPIWEGGRLAFVFPTTI